MSAIRAASRAIGVAVVGAFATAACAAGQQAQTANERPTLDGINGRVGSIVLAGVALQTPTSGPFYAKGSSVPLSVYISNDSNSTDSLTNISSPSFSGWQVVAGSSGGGSASPSGASSSSGSSSAVTLPAGGATAFGLQDLTPSGGGSEQTVVLKNVNADLYPGSAVKITFSFQKAGSVTLTVPVQLSKSPNQQTLAPSYVPPTA